MLGGARLAQRRTDLFIHLTLTGFLFGPMILSFTAASAAGVDQWVLESEEYPGQTDRLAMMQRCNRLAEEVRMYCETGCGNQTGVRCNWTARFDPMLTVNGFETDCVERGALPDSPWCSAVIQ
jgi:hypothetical protein